MKDILTGNEAIAAYEELQASYSLNKLPKKCGYFHSKDCDYTRSYDDGTIIAFDSTSGELYEDYFGNKQEAIYWINL